MKSINCGEPPPSLQSTVYAVVVWQFLKIIQFRTSPLLPIPRVVTAKITPALVEQSGLSLHQHVAGVRFLPLKKLPPSKILDGGNSINH